MQVHQRLEHFLAVVVLRDLEGDERVDVYHAQIKAVRGNGTEIGILCGIGAVRIEGISVAGVGESKGNTKGRFYLLIAQYPADALSAVESQKTLKQYCKLFRAKIL